MKDFSNEWKSSKNPRKQRKYRFNAPLHIKHGFMNAHLSKELRGRYSKRSIGLRKGDKVRIMRGKFRKHEGKIEKIELRKARVFVSGVEITKKDGTKKLLALHPSNIMITELNLDDNRKRPYLKMLNPSIGTYHIEGVPQEINTVEKALNWRNEDVENPFILT